MTCNSSLGRLSFEGAQVQGREAIVTKLTVGFSERSFIFRVFSLQICFLPRASCRLSFEGSQVQGRDAILAKLTVFFFYIWVAMNHLKCERGSLDM